MDDSSDDALLIWLERAPPAELIDAAGRLRDEGHGPVVIPLTGHLDSLYIFDPWMPELLRHHRVVRVDWPP